MKYLTIDDIKMHCRIDSDCEDAELELYATGAEDTVLYICNRTYENLIGTYGEVPAAVRNATLLLVANSYEQRSPVSPQHYSPSPYTFEFMLKEFIVLAGTPLINERNRIIDVLQELNTNISFFAADDESETKTELMDRIVTLWKKYTAISNPTPAILESMRKQLASLQADVDAYLKSLNQA